MKKAEPEIDHGTRRGARFFASNSGYYYLRNKISPCRTEVQQGQIWSGRSPHALYQIQPLGTCKQVDCSPTPFPVTRGVVGLIAGPSKALWRLNYWVRFICPLQPVIAATDLRTRLGRGSEHSPPSHRTLGRPPLLAVRWPVPRVSPLTPQFAISFT